MVVAHFSSDIATILALHHKHMKLVKPFTTHVIAWSVRRGFDQSICITKEQKTRLQCLASAMPKSVMLSGAKNGKVFEEKKRKNQAVLAKSPRLKRFFQQRSQAVGLLLLTVDFDTYCDYTLE